MESQRVKPRTHGRRSHAIDQTSEAKKPASSLDPDSVADTAAYIAQLAAELVRMAADARLEMLAYLLSMARIEAEIIARDRFTK